MSEYFQGSRALQLMLESELTKDVNAARAEEERKTQQQKYDLEEKLNKMVHLNKISEISFEHVQNRADIGTRASWDRQIQEDQRNWQSEENRKSREHDTSERALDRTNALDVARTRVLGSVITTLPKALPYAMGLLGLKSDSNNKDDSSKGKGNIPTTGAVGSTEFSFSSVPNKPYVSVEPSLTKTGFSVAKADDIWDQVNRSEYHGATGEKLSGGDGQLRLDAIKKLNTNLVLPVATGAVIGTLLTHLPILL